MSEKDEEEEKRVRRKGRRGKERSLVRKWRK